MLQTKCTYPMNKVGGMVNITRKSMLQLKCMVEVRVSVQYGEVCIFKSAYVWEGLMSVSQHNQSVHLIWFTSVAMNNKSSRSINLQIYFDLLSPYVYCTVHHLKYVPDVPFIHLSLVVPNWLALAVTSMCGGTLDLEVSMNQHTLREHQ